MKPRNYTSTSYIIIGILFLILNACNSDTKKTENAVTQPTSQQSPPKIEIGDFSLADATLMTNVDKPLKLCLPIETKAEKPSFTVTATKSPLNGTVTLSVVGNTLCFDYKPNSGFDGLDQFDCKVCLTSSGFCQEKTWRIEVKKETTKTITPAPSTPKTPVVVKKKEEPKIETPPPSVLPTRSTIFDPEKKNNDGYVPKNEN